MRVSYWVKYFNNNARCHPESRRRRGTSQPRLVTRRWILAGTPTSLCAILSPAQDDALPESIRAADPAGFRASVLSPVLCATLQSRHGFRKARPSGLSNREILLAACTAELRVVRD